MAQRIVALGSVILILGTAGAGWAAEKYAYKWTPGAGLKYRTLLRSDGTMAMPEGPAQPVKMQATSVLSMTARQQVGDGWKVESSTERGQSSMNGMPIPVPADVKPQKTTITVKADGSVVDASGATDRGMAIVFPDRALDRGDSFAMSSAGDGTPDALPLKTTFTLAETADTLPGHSGKLARFDAKVELARQPATRQVTLKDGKGQVWFDPAAGVLVKSKIGFSLVETTKPKDGAPLTRNLSVVNEMELIPH
jgi:hypothetical protein